MSDSLADRLLDKMAEDDRFTKPATCFHPPSSSWFSVVGWLILILAIGAVSVGYTWWTQSQPPEMPHIRLEAK